MTAATKERVKLPSFHCLRCGHTWHPRKQERPLRCAKCTSPYWNIRPKATE